ncbi:MAG: T9SS type A sorting domain-containing protein [Bacteroidetes bacterium]|nr:T9SS type A sorting domain-containing protein [Bacteroidota bacterium]
MAFALDLDSPAPPNASSGLSLSSVFNVWNPGAGSYSILTADFGDPPAGDILPVWNGAFAEIPGIPPDEAVNFIMDAAFVDPTSNDQLIGREGAGESRIAFTLAGDTESGAHVQDLAAMLRFRDDATLGWDLHDGSKLPGFGGGVTALLAPVGERDGQPRRQSARSLPLVIDEAVETPLAFLASESGNYEIAWNLIDVPAEWFATLRDTESGAEVNMVAESSYVFTADATNWTERFSVTVSPFATANEPTGELPNGYALSSVYPNPFNPQARFTLQVAQTQDVTVSVFDLLGRRVMDLHQGVLSAGTTHAFTLNGRDLASGFYVVRVSGETFSDSRRVTLLK